MFRTSIVHLQERSYAVCCNLVCLDTSYCYEGEGRTAVSMSAHLNYVISLKILTSTIKAASLINLRMKK